MKLQNDTSEGFVIKIRNNNLFVVVVNSQNIEIDATTVN